jgi:CemA family|uniref:Chloroplast envelope membrane protein n=1 Tax=Thorea hispida TaxID=202687 RepID=A0A1C9CAE7_9FLOR|nr:chloroplast envelope membrane protein [Thorea hispida]AOM65347.1 chloroplast envelope membrane protein [Thorea hispida]ARX95908.1 chloroplast envelope membrane protein [Thorea hispida]UNJ79191.1 envelope membrane protein [Thorea hispida]
MKYWKLQKISSLYLDKLKPLPRSFTVALNRFKQELNPYAESEAIEGFRVSRYQTLASIKYLLIIIIAPLVINQFTKHFIIGPIVDHVWNKQHPGIFLNFSQEERAFIELQRYEEKLNFEILIGKYPNLSSDLIIKKIQKKALEITRNYTNESVNALKNMVTDAFSIAIIYSMLIKGRRELSILKSFMNEFIYSLSDTAKAFFIILFSDIFVGFHSPHGWEILLEMILRHFGLPENRDFIFLFISTFPVVLDTIFKYWIFRYLNRISPSAVATYHSMNE